MMEWKQDEYTNTHTDKAYQKWAANKMGMILDRNDWNEATASSILYIRGTYWGASFRENCMHALAAFLLSEYLDGA